MTIPYEVFIKALVGECYAKRNILFILFAIISLSILTVGNFWPKKYTAFTIVHVDESNILQSLIKGTAETTQASDHAANAREIIYGEEIMEKVLFNAGFVFEEQSEISVEKEKQQIRKRTSIKGVSGNLLKVEYQDSDPMRAYKSVMQMTELFIKEGEKSKVLESQNAYGFISKQVDEYLVKLTKVEDELRKFHSENPSARPGLESEVSTRISSIQTKIEQTRLELREAMITKKSIKEQLSGEAAITISHSKEGQYRIKISNLQEDLERLRLDYQDSYPDIVRLKFQINDLKESMYSEIKKREKAKDYAAASGSSYIDEAIILNPLYQQLRANMAQTNTRIATLKVRISEMNIMLDNEYKRARKIFGGEATLAKLTRNYQVNQEIYQDLLRRRENARISRNVDREQQGLTLTIQEPAKVPIIPTGLRFIHFVIIGIFLGVAIPVGLIYMLLNFDPRVRFSEIINNEVNVPVVSEIPIITTLSEYNKEQKNIRLLCVGLIIIFIIYAFVGWSKYTGNM